MQTNNHEKELMVQSYETNMGVKIFAIPMQIFPILRGYAYFIIDENFSPPRMTLIDTGSVSNESNAQLEAGLQWISEKISRKIEFSTLNEVLLTHGHIDHFGGCYLIRQKTSVPIIIHELDLRNLTNYEERIVVISKRLEEYLIEAGVEVNQREQYLDLYRMTKSLGKSISNVTTYQQARKELGRFEVLHLPGHCAGQVVIKLDNILFSGDMVLSHISPHQSPEHLTLYTGLGHYIESLKYLKEWANGIDLTLAGHGPPIQDLNRRIEEIQKVHQERLDKVLDLFKQPQTIAQISNHLFGDVYGYNVLLAIEEAGAHVEYLYSRGYLEIENLAELENNHATVPIVYHRIG
ncbi:MAG: MBL fold metallo-hydrolase [Anaerolineales bacterium]